MKKFPRIFAVILALALVLSSLCVVAFATDDEPVLTPASPYENGFDDREAGSVFGDTADKKGKWTIGGADNGNKFVIGSYATATGNNGQLHQYADYKGLLGCTFEVGSKYGSNGSILSKMLAINIINAFGTYVGN